MSVTVEIGLLSGMVVSVRANRDEQVETLKLRAQTALEVGKGLLVDSSGSVLDACSSIKDARLQNGDILTSASSFAAILGDGSVVTWGLAGYGGSEMGKGGEAKGKGKGKAAKGKGSRAIQKMQDQLKHVQQIHATRSFSGGAFAAILGDGSVVTWGDAGCGADSSAVQDQLKDVQQIQTTFCIFAAILGDRSVVTWGSRPDFGGDSSAVRMYLISKPPSTRLLPFLVMDPS